MAKENIWRHFQGQAEDYDGLIPKIIPYYHEQNEILLNLIPFDADAKLKALDLGAGTGILSELVLTSFPKSKVTAFDLSDKMVKICSEKLRAFENRLDFKLGDFSIDDIGGGYDLVVSGLSIHHLEDNDKERLFKQIYKSLNRGGVLLIRDCINGATSTLTDKYEELWRVFMRGNGEDDAKWFTRHIEEDTPSTVSDQLSWLRSAGFENVDCHWRHLNFAIFGGEKLC